MWDERHLKSLLRLPRFPVRLIQQEPWRAWLGEHGGFSGAHAYLQSADLSPEQRKVLDIILANPYASARIYARQLNVSARTYFKYLRELLPGLLDHLNAAALQRPEPAKVDEMPRFIADPARLANLPAQLTSLIGGERLIQAIQALLARPDARLLTLTGSGGVGKTRLAVEVATALLEAGPQNPAQFPDGIFFVALAPISDPASVASRIAQALGLAQLSQQPVADTLKHFLRERRLLLVLDNFEHLLAAAPLLTECLTAAPRLNVLVTSRTALNVYGEYVFTVPPLDLPSLQRLPPVERLAEYSAVKLFVERAQAVKTDFALTGENVAAVAEICARLDGLPLAIELAAARVKLLSPQDMLPYLKRRLTFLKSKTAYLQERSLRETVDWSYALLDEAEKSLFRRLAVFANGWTAPASRAVCGDQADILEKLESLLNKSLLRRQAHAGAETRFEMLETIREYALERLQASGDSETLRRHAAYYLALAEAAEPELSGAKQKQWLERLECDYDNLRAALEWLLEQHEVELALRLTGAIWKFWHIRSYPGEGQRWIEQALAQSRHIRNAARAKALWGAGWLYHQQNMARSAELFAESLALAREVDDRRLTALALQGLGEVSQHTGERAQAQALFAESLALLRELGDDEETAWALDHLGRLALEQDNSDRADELFQESLLLFRKAGHLWGLAQSFDRLGLASTRKGDYGRARAFFDESLFRLRELGDKWQIGLVLEHAGLAAVKQGDFAQAQAALMDSLQLHAEADHPYGVARSLGLLGTLASAQGKHVRAARLCSAAQALRDLKEMTLAPLDRPIYEKTLADIRSQLDEAAFAAAWAEGQAMTLADALVYVAQ